MKKTISLLAALALMLGCLGGAFAESASRYTTEATADGWIKVVNEGGATLGYSPDSGVTLLEADGYAFKDLNKNGQLDPYEDWRLSYEDRARNAVSLMTIEEMAGTRINPGVMSLNLNGETPVTIGDEEGTFEGFILNNGLKYILSYPHAGMGGYRDWKALAEWANKLQTVAETSSTGLPLIINSDQNNLFYSSIYQMAQAATFTPETVNQLFREVAKSYRAIGVTMMLSPQVDLISDPRTLSNGVFSEDPQLAADMANALINGMQSTYDENGNDLGWGADSVVCQMKHFPANNSVEAGRSYHGVTGKYTVFPGDAFETQLVPYVDGGFYLTGETGQTGALMLSYTIAWSEDGSLGNMKATPLNGELVQLAADYGFDGMVSTDGCSPGTIYDYDGTTLAMTNVEQLVVMFENGVHQLMSSGYSFADVLGAYEALKEAHGEEYANDNFKEAAYKCILSAFRTGEVENPYVNVKASMAFMNSALYIKESVTELAQSTIVMLKNSNQAIKANTSDEKPTVYVPMTYNAGGGMVIMIGGGIGEAEPSWELPVSERTLKRYFNVVTDTVTEPTGENGKYTANDIIRASEEELAACDFALVIIKNPSTGGGYDNVSGEYLPISLQYSEYVAESDGVRDPSIAGDQLTVETQTPYGIVTTTTNENRTYYGKSVVASNLSDMELVQDVAARVPETVPVIVCVNASGAMIFSEIEPYADSILYMFGQAMFGDCSNENFLPIVTGQYEPSALLPVQMPKDMDTVEAQYEDVPRDMECYVDADGNTYDFTFGLNWSGVINDERVARYNVPALTAPAHQRIAE